MNSKSARPFAVLLVCWMGVAFQADAYASGEMRGRQAVSRSGCGACHQIPGVPGAVGRTGPPLGNFDRRLYIAGRLPNTADNLVLWLLDPPAIKPGTAMPIVGLDKRAAREIAVYLLRGR
jgi:cytochrome c1